MTRRAWSRAPRSPRPVCPTCGKVWAPDRATASLLHQEIADETGRHNPVRFYEAHGGVHWTSEIQRRGHAA